MKKEQQDIKTKTDMDSIKQQVRRSGLSYNEAKEWIAEQTGGRDTHIYSDTDVNEVKSQNENSNAKQVRK